MLNITLPDGSLRQFPGPVTVAEVAASIGSGLAKAALGGKVDGKLVDTSYRIEQDAGLAIVTAKDADGLELIRRLLPAAAATRASLLAVEVGQGRADGVAALARAAGFAQAGTVTDLAGIERVVVATR